MSLFLDEKSSDESGGIRQRVNTSSSAPFQEERLGCTCKNSKGDALPNFFGLKFGQILLGGGECQKLAHFLGYVKQQPQS